MGNFKSSVKMAAVVKSEDVLGQKWDRCLVDCGIKMGSGLAVGAVLSLVLFKRRAWPLFFGTGSGFGMAYSNCEREINSAVKKSCASNRKCRKNNFTVFQ